MLLVVRPGVLQWAFPAHSFKGRVCVCVFMWASGPCPSQARSCSLRLCGSKGAPVNVCCVWFCVVCEDSVGGHARCLLGPVHNWDRIIPEQVLACACMRGLVCIGRTGVAPVAPLPAVQRKIRLAGSGQLDTDDGVRREGVQCLRVNSVWKWVLTELSSGTGRRELCSEW